MIPSRPAGPEQPAPWAIPSPTPPAPTPPAGYPAPGRYPGAPAVAEPPLVPHWSLRSVPAFWLLGIVLALSGLAVLAAAALFVFYAPTAAVCTLILVTALAVAWLAALRYLGDPVERRPAWLVVAAVMWGSTVAILVGAGGGYLLDTLVARAVSPAFAAQWGAAIAAPYAEEIGKGAGVVMVLLIARPYVTTVWSGAVYGALVGLGFALAEDASYALMAADAVLPDDVGAAAEVLLLRLLVPGLVGHPVFTAAAGAGIAYAWLRRDRTRRRRLGVLAVGFAGAAAMHAAVNSPLAFGATELLAELPYGSAWAGYLTVVTAIALPWLWWLLRIRRADAVLVLSRTAALAPDAVRPQEVAVLAGLRARLLAGRRIRRADGGEAARRARQLRRAQLRLAAAAARPYRGYPAVGPYGVAPPVQRWWQEALQARHAMQSAAEPSAPRPGHPAPRLEPSAPQPAGTAGARASVGAGAVLVVAAGGLLVWPAAVLAVVAAGVLRWRGQRGRRTSVAVATAAFSGYCALVTVVFTVLEAS